jgi:type I site-specific restriction-modification system R (restriction) subunit
MESERNGGVVWHTQEVTESLTMAMLAIVTIKNPKSFWLRIELDLDHQI